MRGNEIDGKGSVGQINYNCRNRLSLREVIIIIRVHNISISASESLFGLNWCWTVEAVKLRRVHSISKTVLTFASSLSCVSTKRKDHNLRLWWLRNALREDHRLSGLNDRNQRREPRRSHQRKTYHRHEVRNRWFSYCFFWVGLWHTFWYLSLVVWFQCRLSQRQCLKRVKHLRMVFSIWRSDGPSYNPYQPICCFFSLAQAYDLHWFHVVLLLPMFLLEIRDLFINNYQTH